MQAYRVKRSLEDYLKDLPLLHQELALGVAREGETRVGGTHVLAVVIADGELRIASFLVRFVHNTDIATTKNWTLLRVVRNCELNQVQRELLSHIQAEDKAL